MRVSAEAGESMLGACERRLRVDDPVATAQLVARPRNGGVVVELSAFEDLPMNFPWNSFDRPLARTRKPLWRRGEDTQEKLHAAAIAIEWSMDA
jgi:hypothetical protein